MGPRNSVVDNVIRMREFVKRHPYVTVTTPKSKETDEFAASWIGEDGKTKTVSYGRLGWLMDDLEKRFDRDA